MTSKTLEIMKQLIEEKKKKSASQSSGKRGPANVGSAHPGKKHQKKTGGVFDK